MALSRPWVNSYTPGVPGDITPDFQNALALYQASLERNPDGLAICYFDGTLTFGELDAASDAFALALRNRGFEPGDRLGLYLQNTPEFVIGVLAAWKLGGVAVPINPMNQRDEVLHVLHDAEIAIVVGDEGAGAELLASLMAEVGVVAIASSPLAYQTRNDDRVLPVDSAGVAGGLPTMTAEIESYRGRTIEVAVPGPDDPAFITYTSGTTGRSKGAVNHHGAVAFSAQVYREWVPLGSDDRVMGLAPMSGITGLICGLASALIAGCPLVLHYRFSLPVVRDVLVEQRPTFLLAAPTLFIALLNDKDLRPDDLPALKAYCGGAPVPPALLERWKERFGSEIRTAYGLTEATGPTHIAPPGRDIPVDSDSGALAIGIPIPNTDVVVADQHGQEVPVGELGEFLIRGPQIIHRYWHLPEASHSSVKDGWLHTGDLGKRDERGWFYLVERIKDIIIASGYNVIPREVEEALFQHPAVLEAAVVGVPDAYRGETVTAFVTLRDGHHVEPSELVAFARKRLSAYKCPTALEIISELPKSTNGKILKRHLRDAATATTR